jgi:Predicted hydrolases or acyltransferases (alpha/beta hydrolase superfamily)
MSTYIINDQVLHVREEGPTDAPIAILIHGWCSSWYTWKPLLPVLSKRFRCLAVDLPGYGSSPEPKKPPTIAWYADIIAELIRYVSDRAVLVLGHSMGGQIAMTLSLRNPPLVERLVLLNPAVSGHLSTFINIFISPLILLERTTVSGTLIQLLEKTPIGHSYTDRVLKPITFAERARATVSPEDFQRIRADARKEGQGRIRAICFRAMREGDLRSQLHKLSVPALVIWGAEDNTVPLRDAGSVAAEWPSADLRLIPNAGHWPHFEQYETTIHYISSFLGLPTIHSLQDEEEPNQSAEMISEIAQFLASSDVGHAMNLAQRTRLAAQFRLHSFRPHESIATENSDGNEMFVIYSGVIEVWTMIANTSTTMLQPRCIAKISAGQVVGEMAILDNHPRSADLRASAQGAQVLSLSRSRFNALCEEDPALGQQVVRNIARALALRLRLQNWQLQMNAQERDHYFQAQAQPQQAS